MGFPVAGERGNLLLRALDRGLGIPLVRAAGLCRRRRHLPARIESIGALCLGCIGDLVLFSGPLADILRERPQARLTLFCSRANQDVARMVPGVAEVVVLPVKNPLKAVAEVRRHPLCGDKLFDVWLDTSQWPRLGALLSLAARARFKAGFESPGQHRHHAYDAVARHGQDCHELDNFRKLTNLLGIPGSAVPVLEPLAGAAAALPEALGRALPAEPYAVLHLFPGGFRSHMKQWPLEHWRELAQALLRRGLLVLLSGGPADREGNEELLRTLGPAASGRVLNLAGVRVGPTTLLLKHAKLVVSVNTGIMHLAAAVGAPLVSITGPVDEARWGAAARPGLLAPVVSPLPCAPCLHLGFEYPCRDNACMRAITPGMALSAAESLLGREGA